MRRIWEEGIRGKEKLDPTKIKEEQERKITEEKAYIKKRMGKNWVIMKK
jgi:hypothetical protein